MPDTRPSVKQPAPPIDPTKETGKIEPGGEGPGPVGPNDGPNITKGTERGAPGTPSKAPAS